MKLSFVIPAYNEEAYIKECLESILADAGNSDIDFEIIVVNNASTDKTEEIASAYPAVKMVFQPEKGLTKARQSGFNAATGHLIANIDADNRLPSGWTKKVFEEFSQDEELVALSGPLDYYDLPENIKKQVKNYYRVGRLTAALGRLLTGSDSIVQGGNFVLRRSALEKIGGFNTDIAFYGEDTDIAKRMYKVGKVKFSFDLPIFSSGRRLAKEGVINTATRYIANYFWVLLFKKPLTNREEEDVREFNREKPRILNSKIKILKGKYGKNSESI